MAARARRRSLPADQGPSGLVRRQEIADMLQTLSTELKVCLGGRVPRHLRALLASAEALSTRIHRGDKVADDYWEATLRELDRP